MQMVFNSTDDVCPWYYFDSSYKTLLGACLIVVGVFGVLLNGWLFATFIHSHLLICKHHVLVLNLCSASLGRNLLGFPFASASAIANRWLFGTRCCQLFAFLNQFFGVFQITALFALVLERYLQAKCYIRVKNLNFRFYWALISLCWITSVVFATLPLFGLGLYSCDATGSMCSLQWPSLDSNAKQLGFTVLYVFICGVIPIVGMFFFMRKTIRLEKIYYRRRIQRREKLVTKTIHIICVTTLVFWIPSALLACLQWFPLMVYGYRLHVPPVLAVVAPIASEAAPSVPVLCYLIGNEGLRTALLGRIQNQYALLHPEISLKYKRKV